MGIILNTTGKTRDSMILLLFLIFIWYSHSQDYRVQATVSLDPTNSYTFGERSSYYVGMGGLSFSQTSNWIQHNPECILPFTVNSRTDYVVVADNQKSKTCYFEWFGPTPSTVNTYVEGNLPVVIRQTTHDTFSVLHSVSYGQPITPCTTYSSWDTNTDNREVPPLTRIDYTFIPYNERILNTIPGSTLSVDQKFKLEFQSGNIASGWRYSVDKGNSWTDFGNIEMSLFDLGITMDDLPNKQIIFQGIACGNLNIYSDDLIIIDVIPSSPSLINVQYTHAGCYDSNDGNVSLIFSENVETNYKMRYFLYDANTNINFDPIKENPPQAIEQEVLDELVPENDGSGYFRGTLPVGLTHGNYKIVYQEFYDAGKGAEIVIKSGGITTPFTIDQPTRAILDTSAPNFFTDATCGQPAAFNLYNTASGGNNLVPDGSYSYGYSLDNGLKWTVVTAPDHILEIASITKPQSVQIRGVYTVEGNSCPGETYQYLISETITPIFFTDSSTGTTSTAVALDGSVRIELSGGAPPYIYSISRLDTNTNTFDPIPATPFPINIPGGTAVSFNNLPTGLYHITVTDADNCLQISPELIIGTDTIPILGTPEVTQMECEDSYGSISIPVSGFNTDYRYQWISNGILSTIQNGNGPNIILDDISVAGIYVLRVSAGRVSDSGFENDMNVTSTAIHIKGPTLVDIINAVPKNTRCNDTNDGSIVLTVSGGTSYEYTLELFPAETDWLPLTGTTITNLTPGTYRVTVRNQSSCESNTLQNIVVNRTPLLETTAIKTDVTTNGGSQGSITLDITGGTPFSPSKGPYTISWKKDSLPYTDTDLSTPYFIDGLAAGNYNVTVTDTNGCNNIINVTITQPEPIVATIVQTAVLDCNGDDYAEITTSVQGGSPPYSYSWYQIINSNNTLLSKDTEIIGGLYSGTYFLRLTDSKNDVVESTPLTISHPNALIAEVENVTDVSCMGEATGAISITVSGGTAPYTYFWSNGATTPNLINVEAGDYTLEVMDANACYVEVTTTIDSSTEAIQIIDATVNHVSEYEAGDGSISLTISGRAAPYTINWIRLSDNTDIGNRTTISDLSAGTYQATIADINGCSTTGTYKIIQPDIVEETIIPPTCWGGANGRITILVNQGKGDYTFHWHTGENTSTITNLKAGSYTVIINGFGNGPITRTYMVEAPPPLPIDLEKNSTICKGQNLTLNASVEDDSATYSWTSDVGFTSNEPNILVSVGGNYMVTVTSPNGCSVTESVFVDRVDDEINAEFAMASQVFVGESLIAVDISFPLPESQEWVIPDEATVVKQDSDEAELIFNKAGEYKIGIVTRIGDCRAQQYKKVVVMANDGPAITSKNKDPRPHIKDFIIHPNPTTGKFIADILLPETGPIALKVFNFANNTLMARENAMGDSSYSIPLDLFGRPAGIYAVVLETPFGNSLRKIILN